MGDFARVEVTLSLHVVIGVSNHAVIIRMPILVKYPQFSLFLVYASLDRVEELKVVLFVKIWIVKIVFVQRPLLCFMLRVSVL